MFEENRIADVVDTWAEDGVLDQRGLPGPLSKEFIGRRAQKTFFSRLASSIEWTKFEWKVLNVDEGRGTSLVHVTMSGKIIPTQRSFSVHDHLISFEWEDHHVVRSMGWIEDQAGYLSMSAAYKTQAQETVELLFQNYFTGKMADAKKLFGSQIGYVGAPYNPFVGEFTFEEFLTTMMPRIDAEFSEIKFVHVSQNDVIVQLRYSKLVYVNSGQSLALPADEYLEQASITVSNAGQITKYSVTSFPQPGIHAFFSPVPN